MNVLSDEQVKATELALLMSRELLIQEGYANSLVIQRIDEALSIHPNVIGAP